MVYEKKVRLKTWTVLRYNSETLSACYGNKRYKKYLYSLFVIPVFIRIDGLNRLFNGFWHEGLQKKKSLTLELGEVID